MFVQTGLFAQYGFGLNLQILGKFNVTQDCTSALNSCLSGLKDLSDGWMTLNILNQDSIYPSKEVKHLTIMQQTFVPLSL